MLEAREFTFERFADVALQPEQLHEPPSLEYFAVLSRGHAVAMVDGQGHTVGCGGLCPVKDGSEAVAWTYIGRDAGAHMTGLMREMRRALRERAGRFEVIKTATLGGFGPGCRMLAMLGFSQSSEMFKNGRHYLIWERRGINCAAG